MCHWHKGYQRRKVQIPTEAVCIQIEKLPLKKVIKAMYKILGQK